MVREEKKIDTFFGLCSSLCNLGFCVSIDRTNFYSNTELHGEVTEVHRENISKRIHWALWLSVPSSDAQAVARKQIRRLSEVEASVFISKLTPRLRSASEIFSHATACAVDHASLCNCGKALYFSTCILLFIVIAFDPSEG
jgi:hypothetical protein